MSHPPAWFVDAFGVAAGLCSMLSFIPQIVKILRERNAEGVSLTMYAVTIFGFCCWVVYGALTGAWPVAVSNAVCVAFAVTIFALRVRFGDGDSPNR